MLMFGILNVVFAVPDEGNIRIDSEGEHCLYIYSSSEIKWNPSEVETGPHPSTWTASSAVVLIYKGGALIKTDTVSGSLGKYTYKYPSNGKYKLEVIVEYKADSGCRDCTTQYFSKTFLNTISPVLVEPISPTSLEIGTECSIDLSTTVSCGMNNYEITWSNSQVGEHFNVGTTVPYTATFNTEFNTEGQANIRVDVVDGAGDYGGKSMTVNVHEHYKATFPSTFTEVPGPRVHVYTYENNGCLPANVTITESKTTTVTHGVKISGNFPLSALIKWLPAGVTATAEYNQTRTYTTTELAGFSQPVQGCTIGRFFMKTATDRYDGTWEQWDCQTKTTGSVSVYKDEHPSPEFHSEAINPCPCVK
jgi:hypothetical protein